MSVARILGTTLFGAMAAMQALRFAQAWPVSINGVSVPVWASAIAALGFATMAVLTWRDGKRR